MNLLQPLALSTLVDIVGVAGFVLSALTLLTTFWKGRKRLNVIIDFDCTFGAAFLTSLFHTAAIAFLFENKSSNSVSVTSVQICCNDGGSFRCNLHRCFVAHKFHRSIDPGTNNYDRFIESTDFPINLCAYGAAYEYIIFSLPKGRAWDDIKKLTICTNRGPVHINNHDIIRKLEEFLQKPLQEKHEKQKVLQQPVEIQ